MSVFILFWWSMLFMPSAPDDAVATAISFADAGTIHRLKMSDKAPYSPRVDRINRYASTDSKQVHIVEFSIPYKSPTPAAVEHDRPFSLMGKSAMEQVFLEKERFDYTRIQSPQLTAAKNEQEALQMVIVPHQPLREVTWSLTDFKNQAGQTLPTSISMVGYVDIQLEPRYTIPAKGWYPDPILDAIFSVSSIPVTEILPLYIKVDVPADADAGQYTATLTVQSREGAEALQIELEVWDFTLPVRSHHRFIGQFYRLNSMSQFMPPKEPAASFHERARLETERFEDWMLKNRMQPGNIYSASPPDWGEQRLKELVRKGLNALNLSYIRIDRREANHFNEAAHWKRVDEQIARINAYIPVLKRSGVWDDTDVLKYIFLFDEWPGKQAAIVYETARRLKAEFPEITLVTTMYDHSYGVGTAWGDLIDIWVPHVDVLGSNKKYMDYARSQGVDFGWYLAVGAYAPYPNFWIENNVIQSRISMGALSFKYDTSLFLYWAFNRWFNNNPAFLEKGPKTRWRAASYGTKNKNVAHGEGSLFYARTSNGDPLGTKPVPTLRSENIRDGLEDFEYFVLLEQLYRERGIAQAIVSDAILENVGTYTDDPRVIQAERARIAAEILKYQ